jgi:putative transposase
MPRQARLDALGTLHHVIVHRLEKRRIVDNVKDQEAFVSRLGGIVKETKTAIYGRNILFERAQAGHILIEDFGITLAEVARNLGVTTSAIFNMLKRKNDKFN